MFVLSSSLLVVRDVLNQLTTPIRCRTLWENQDLIPHSEESKGGCSNKKDKLESNPTRASNMEEQATEAKSTPKKSEVKCYRCKEYGHKCSDVIPTNEARQRHSPDCQSFMKSYRTGGRRRRRCRVGTKREATDQGPEQEVKYRGHIDKEAADRKN